MHKNPIWLLLLLVIGLVTAWYGWHEGERLWEYSRLSQKAPAHISGWDTEAFSADEYAPIAFYTFEALGHTYQVSGVATNARFRNEWAALSAIKELQEQQEWTVWYNPSDPLHSSLVHIFPWKDLFYLVVLLSVFSYFIWLGYRVGV
jgi:hypothetical protein